MKTKKSDIPERKRTGAPTISALGVFVIFPKVALFRFLSLRKSTNFSLGNDFSQEDYSYRTGYFLQICES